MPLMISPQSGINVSVCVEVIKALSVPFDKDAFSLFFLSPEFVSRSGHVLLKKLRNRICNSSIMESEKMKRGIKVTGYNINNLHIQDM